MTISSSRSVACSPHSVVRDHSLLSLLYMRLSSYCIHRRGSLVCTGIICVFLDQERQPDSQRYSLCFTTVRHLLFASRYVFAAYSCSSTITVSQLCALLRPKPPQIIMCCVRIKPPIHEVPVLFVFVCSCDLADTRIGVLS